jgi:hypothetical protein
MIVKPQPDLVGTIAGGANQMGSPRLQSLDRANPDSGFPAFRNDIGLGEFQIDGPGHGSQPGSDATG